MHAPRAGTTARRIPRIIISSGFLSLFSLSLDVRIHIPSLANYTNTCHDKFSGFLIFAIVSVVVSKHRRPNLSDAANRRRELERQRQLDSSRALMGYAAYAQVNSGGTDPKGLPPSPLPQNAPIIPVIKVYPASIRRTSLSTIASQSDTEDHRVSYQQDAEEDQEPMLSHAVPPGESVDGDHDTPPVSIFFVTGCGPTDP